MSRISKREVEGAPPVSDFEDSIGSTDETEEGLEKLHAEDAMVEVGLSMGYIVDKCDGASASVRPEVFSYDAGDQERVLTTNIQNFTLICSVEG